jgi:PPOX class probable F420-dependent enzyme
MVWMDVDGDEVLFNTAEGRKKLQDLRRDSRVIVSVQDLKNPQAYAVFHGKARIVEEGARAHIDKLAKRFLGVDKYPGPPAEQRVIVRISVDRISGVAPGYKSWT